MNHWHNVTLKHPGSVTKTITIPGNVFLAPIAGYSDAAFRARCLEQGAALCYTEMVSAEALIRKHPGTFELLAFSDAEAIRVVQLFGARPEALAEAVSIIAPMAHIIDLNCGCPVPKIVRNGAGSALMREPDLLWKIVSAMVTASGPNGPPVTVKIRLGWDSLSLSYREAAQAAVSAGAAAVALHPRTKAQAYSGLADWDAIGTLASLVDVPVFGSGDIRSPEDAQKMLDTTGCAAVMIGRASIGNPFIFAQTKALLQEGEWAGITDADRQKVARAQLYQAAGFLGETRACLEFRKHFCMYCRGFPGSVEWRRLGVLAQNLEDYEKCFAGWAAATHALQTGPEIIGE